MKNFKYFMLCIAINLALAFIALVLCKPLIVFITTRFFIQLLIYSVLLILINPILTYVLVNMIENKLEVVSNNKEV